MITSFRTRADADAVYLGAIPQSLERVFDTETFRFRASRCQVCGTASYPPTFVCQSCGARIDEAHLVPVTKRGTLESFTTVHRSPARMLPPYVLGSVIADGLRIVAPIGITNESVLQLDIPVVAGLAIFETAESDAWVATFAFVLEELA